MVNWILIGVILILLWGLIVKKSNNTNVPSEMEERFKLYYNLYSYWLRNIHNGKSIKDYFHVKNMHSIAIYGLGDVGMRFYEELENSDINITYFVDKNALNSYKFSGIPVINIDQISQQKRVDLIIITPIYDFTEIKHDILKQGYKGTIISIEDIVYEL